MDLLTYSDISILSFIYHNDVERVGNPVLANLYYIVPYPISMKLFLVRLFTIPHVLFTNIFTTR